MRAAQLLGELQRTPRRAVGVEVAREQGYVRRRHECLSSAGE